MAWYRHFNNQWRGSFSYKSQITCIITHDTLFSVDYSFRLRSNVCRRFDNTSVTTLLVCGVGPKDEPINGDNTIPQSFETTMKMWGVDDKELDRIRQTIVNGSERLLDRIIQHECLLSSDLRGGAGAETDLIGRCFIYCVCVKYTNRVRVLNYPLSFKEKGTFC
jgi:hypothetical protein